MSTLRTKIRKMAWLAPGVVLLGGAALAWNEASECDSGGCAVGAVVALVALPFVWLAAAAICARVATWLAAQGRLNAVVYLLVVVTIGCLPCIPLVAIAVWRQFFIAEAIFLISLAATLGLASATLWWGMKYGPTFTPLDAPLPPNKSLERTREG